MGKSAASELLRQHNVPTVDTDILARQVVQPGQPALQQILDAFGDDVLSESGELRRDVLAIKAFSDTASRLRLESILHPPIRALWREQVTKWEKQGRPTAVVVIPLLFETGAERELDATICVACLAATQSKRLSSRRWSAEQTRQRMDAQLPIDQKIAKADFVIWNEAGLDVLWAQLARVIEAR